MSYLDIGALCLIEIVGDFGYKEFANKGGIQNFAIGTAGYIGVIYFLIRSLQGSQILMVNAAWDAISTIIESIAAMVVLGERYDDPWQYVGLFLIIVGLGFLKLPLVRKKRFVFPEFFSGMMPNKN